MSASTYPAASPTSRTRPELRARTCWRSGPAPRSGNGSPAIAATASVAPLSPAAPQIAPVSWSRSNARALIEVIEAAAAEGLDPADYKLARLRDALDRGLIDPVLFNESAMRLASDYRYGRVARNERVDWASEAANPALLAGLRHALDDARQHEDRDAEREAAALLTAIAPGDPLPPPRRRLPLA